MRLVGPVGAAVLVILGSCNSRPPAKARVVKPDVVRDVPSVLRGTIGAEASLSKRAKPELVSSYGLVVGLAGTGGGELPTKVAATMERELGLMQMNRANDDLADTIFAGRTPAQILRMKEVAVVIVYAQVAPGAPDGTTFDVYVTSVNKGSDISLEGGILYTTDLHPGPPAPFGSIKTKPIARARGPIFINPFSDPAAKEGFSGQNGRILGGGTISNSMDLEIVLDNESHSRAASMVSAINGRFPAPAGKEAIARGRTARIIHVTVPPQYRDDAESFLQTLMHIQIQQGQAPEFAKRYADAIKTQPALADELSWCLQALPQKAAVPFLRDLYDSGEIAVRMAALRAGAALGDALAAPVLKEMSKSGPAVVRAECLKLLGKLPGGPTVDMALRDQLDASERSVRVAAYEALVDRAEAVQLRRLRDQMRPLPPGVRLARRDEPAPVPLLEFGGDTLQGVKRQVIEKKFVLDIVPSGDPMVYVTQRGRPRIVLFGGDKLELTKPSVVSTWSDRLMLSCDSSTDDFRVYYKMPDRVDEAGDVIPGIGASGKAPSDLASLIEFMAHEPSTEDPRPGLGLTYSEVVGALYAFQKGRAIPASFAIEDDLAQARLLAQSREAAVPERPDTKKDAATIRVFEAPTAEEVKPKPIQSEPMVVPLPQPRSQK